MIEPRIISIVIFIVAYISFILLTKRRSIIAIAAAGLLVVFNALSLKEAFLCVNWNVIGIFIGTLLVADIFMESRVPAYIAGTIVNKAHNTAWAILFVCILSGIISAFVENVATVLIVAPIALSLAKQLKINPINMMIAIAISSNLQGTATLIGDPPSMLLGGFAKMNFWDFFVYKGKLSIFFAVEVGALISFIILYLFFKHNKAKAQDIEIEKVKSWTPTVILVSLIILLATSSFLDKGFSYAAGIICMLVGIISLLWSKYNIKKSILDGLHSLDWDTTFFLMGIFVIVGSLTANGWIETISNYLSQLVGTNIFLGYTLIVFVSVFISAFVDNVPFLAAMLPVAVSMSTKLNINPELFLFGLLIGTSIGGNITPIGASANIVACSLLEKEGYSVSFRQFIYLGLPFTIAATIAAYLFIWLIWA